MGVRTMNNNQLSKLWSCQSEHHRVINRSKKQLLIDMMNESIKEDMDYISSVHETALRSDYGWHWLRINEPIMYRKLEELCMYNTQ